MTSPCVGYRAQVSEPGSTHHESEVAAELAVLTTAVGGWRGMLDSGLPSVVFVIWFIADGRVLRPALLAALVMGALLLALRLVRRQRTTQALAGFVGLLLSAYVARATGKAANFYLLGLLTNAGYGLALVVSILVRWPLLGVAVGAMRGDLSTWRNDPIRRRVYTVATWAWVGLFTVRLVVEVPLYLLGWVGPLGVAKIALGLPLYALVAYLTYRLLAPTLRPGVDSAT